MLPWWEWPQEFKIKNNKFLESWIKKKSEEILIKKLIQWHLDEQWSAIKNYAKSKNINAIYNYNLNLDELERLTFIEISKDCLSSNNTKIKDTESICNI